MKYRDLVQFEAIDSVIQIGDANEHGRAAKLVNSYVVSDEMAERLNSVIIPALRFDQPADTKGLLIVGNYGTGKSHLMSVVSAVAEHADLASVVQPNWEAAAQHIAGRFRVVRTEIGSTTMALRDIVTDVLETQLAGLGVEYRFPAASEVSETKSSLAAMMTAFHATFPDQGLLVVVDELLDYLSTRDDQALRLDLGFLREVGEVCRDLRFRFVAGVQEAVFDNPRFAHAAQSLMRVRARFEQVHIASRDVAYVVSQRLLSKTDEQRSWIREHLERFAPGYGSMTERMDDFVRLFPVHPDYLRTFEQVRTAEKREIFKTLSRAMTQMLDQDVPDDQPGLLSYDSYWAMLRDDPAFRTNPDIRTVVDCSRVLETKVQQAYTRPAYRPAALRLVHALSVHRLTTGDIHAAVGMTPSGLRDELCIYQPGIEELGGDRADDLAGFVETALREIVRTVNGQFISVVADTSQYYLDVRKDVDHDALIEQRAGSLDHNALNRRYYAALTQIMERTDEYYPGTHLAWDDELEWTQRHAARLGYLFFGTPNERSTAQPPRDYYLYFLQPYDPPTYQDDQRADEVFFRLDKPDPEFTKSLRLYAAAEDLAAPGGPHQPVYRDKARDHLRDLVAWLRRHMLTNYTVIYRGQAKPLVEWRPPGPMAGSGTEPNIRDLVRTVSSACLANHFTDQAPEYPSFDGVITTANRPQAAQEAMRCIASSNITAQGRAVLSALGLLGPEQALQPGGSAVASHIAGALKAKGAGQVVNRAELITDVHGVGYLAPDRFRLEPEWVAVVLTALVWSGDIVLAVKSTKFDASGLGELARTPVADVAEFKHIERPSEWDVSALQALFELLQLPPGLAQQVIQGQALPVQQLQTARTERVNAIVEEEQKLQEGLTFWGLPVLTEQQIELLGGRFTAAREFLESLQTYNTHGRLKNLRYSADEVHQQRPNLQTVREFRALRTLISDLGPQAAYLLQAEGALPEGHAWVKQARDVKHDVAAQLGDPEARAAAGFRSKTEQLLLGLKADYVETYMALHRSARLNLDDDKRKERLLTDYRHEQLKALASIELLPTSQLPEFQNDLASVKSCMALTTDGLAAKPQCPHCGYWPAAEQTTTSASQRVTMLDQRLDVMVKNWTDSLLSTLEDPTIQASMELLPAEQRQRIETLLTDRQLPDDIDTVLIQAVRAAVSGLEKLAVPAQRLQDALASGGSAVTPDELRARFDKFLDDVTRGKDPSKVRIVLE